MKSCLEYMAKCGLNLKMLLFLSPKKYFFLRDSVPVKHFHSCVRYKIYPSVCMSVSSSVRIDNINYFIISCKNRCYKSQTRCLRNRHNKTHRYKHTCNLDTNVYNFNNGNEKKRYVAI